jgi:uncharacterized membrane protein
MQREVAESAVQNAVQWLRLGVETLSAVIVAIGVVLALRLFVRSALTHQKANFNEIRLVLARYLALALEFQLGSDILSTAIAPGWEQIGKLGAIAVIRTVLNYFLGREIKDEQEAQRQQAEQQVHQHAGNSADGTDNKPPLRAER